MKDTRILTIKTKEGRNEYVAEVGQVVKDRVGRTIGFDAVATSPNYRQKSMADKWITKLLNN